jgi:small subunit ribosomal protein S8
MDKISEMLVKIKNAQTSGHQKVLVSFSKLKFAVAKVLEKEGFVESVSRNDDEKSMIKIILKYYKISSTKKIPAITDLKKISKAGRRVYIKSKDIRNVKNKFGRAIISTSKGVMSGEESRKLGLGGEYLCEVW